VTTCTVVYYGDHGGFTRGPLVGAEHCSLLNDAAHAAGANTCTQQTQQKGFQSWAYSTFANHPKAGQ